jgi:hypothetical protein
VSYLTRLGISVTPICGITATLSEGWESGHCGTSESCRFCCKSLKKPGDKFPARRRNKPRLLIDVASGSLRKSPVSLSPMIVRRTDDRVRLYTRRGFNWADRYPRIVEALHSLRVRSIVIDGEAVWCGNIAGRKRSNEDSQFT